MTFIRTLKAYPVYSVLDPGRPLLYVSNDARCTVEVIDVSTTKPQKVGNFTSCKLLIYIYIYFQWINCGVGVLYPPASCACDQPRFNLQTLLAALTFGEMPTMTPLRTIISTRICGHALLYAGAEIEYNSQAAYDPETKMLYTAAQHASSFAVVNMTDPTNPVLAGLLQDSNRTARNQTFAGATGCMIDPRRKLAFVASEYSKTFAVVEVASPTKPQVVGTVTHPALSGEAVQYDRVRQRAFVASRTASALVVVDVRLPTAPTVIGIFSSKQNSTADAV